jgi:predicted helicase
MPSRHHHTAHFLQSGLYDNLSTFSDLETRISQLDTNKQRGDAFEVFAQGYLATQKTAQAKEVWPFESIPESVKRQLSIDTHIDMGVDGVYETTVGDLMAYQVKFRSGRPSLTWDKLSTFMGLTEQVDERVLFTNCDNLPEAMNDRSRFFCTQSRTK